MKPRLFSTALLMFTVPMWTGSAEAGLKGLQKKAKHHVKSEVREHVERTISTEVSQRPSTIDPSDDLTDAVALAVPQVGAFLAPPRGASTRSELAEMTASEGDSLAVFGLDTRSGEVPREAVIAELTQLVGMLDRALTRPGTEPSHEEIARLAPDAATVRDRPEVGDLDAAQRIMDRRWVWVLAE